MKKSVFFAASVAIMLGQINGLQAQTKSTEKLNPVVEKIVNEVNNNSELENLAYELLDGVGPRLVGSPEMLAANEWSANKLKSWGIDAQLQQYGTWKGWQRGTSHIDMVYPRVKTLTGTQLAWSPATKKAVEAEVITLPKVSSRAEFDKWLPNAKGKIVLFM